MFYNVDLLRFALVFWRSMYYFFLSFLCALFTAVDLYLQLLLCVAVST